MRIQSLCRALAILLLVACPTRAATVTAIAVDAINPHYLDVNGAAVPLIGLSGDFLPHVSRPAQLNTVCTFDKIPPGLTQYSYAKCLNNLQSSNLNKMQVVIALDSSPGWDDNKKTGGAPPYTAEQPVVWDGSATFPKWHLDQYDDLGYFANLNQVIRDAATRGIVVEVVLVDQWDGDSTHGPWDPSRNYGSGSLPAGFTSTQRRLVTSYESGTGDTTPAVQRARTLQKALIAHVVSKLASNANLYWEISNEADLVPSSQTAPDLTGLVNWHNDIATIISNNDPKKHPIAVNFVTQDALNLVLAGQLPKVQIVNGHYAQLANSTGQTTYGALPMVRAYLNGTVGNLNLAFGFNEGKASPNPSTVGARAEAWEFMLNEGAAYDNYNLGAFASGTTAIRGYLTRLVNFLQPYTHYFSNANFARDSGSTPVWATGLSASGTRTMGEDTQGQTYWAAMFFRRQVYGLYIHHSCIPATSTGSRYKPVCNKPAGYQETLQLVPGNLAGFFNVEWFTPDQDTPICNQLLNWPDSGFASVTSPHYTYDLALRLTRCVDATCAPVRDCSTMTASVCPTDAFPDTVGTCPP